VPPAFGQAIYELAAEPRELWLVRGADHLRTWNGEAARDLLVAKLDDALRATKTNEAAALARRSLESTRSEAEIR
jgi:hypothetical protein